MLVFSVFFGASHVSFEEVKGFPPLCVGFGVDQPWQQRPFVAAQYVPDNPMKPHITPCSPHIPLGLYGKQALPSMFCSFAHTPRNTGGFSNERPKLVFVKLEILFGSPTSKSGVMLVELNMSFQLVLVRPQHGFSWDPGLLRL